MLVIFHFPGRSGKELSARAILCQNMDLIKYNFLWEDISLIYVSKRKLSEYFIHG